MKARRFGFPGHSLKRVMRVAAVVFFAWSGAFLSAQEEQNVPWLLMSEGRRLFDAGEFGLAMERFLAAQADNSLYPEAIYWIGRIYEAEGESVLAEQQYAEALRQSRFLYNSEQELEIRYRIAELYAKTGNNAMYEQTMREIVYRELPPGEAEIRQENNMIRLLKEEDIDEVLYYYRFTFDRSAYAMESLGQFYYSRHQYGSALVYNLYAVLNPLSGGIGFLRSDDDEWSFPLAADDILEMDPDYLARRIVRDLAVYENAFDLEYDTETLEILDPRESWLSGLEQMRRFDPEYSLSGLDYLIDTLHEGPFRSVLESRRFYRSLYYLGCSLSALGYDTQARQIWKTLSYREQSGAWRRRASLQLESPFIDESGI